MLYRLNKKGFILYAICLVVIFLGIAVGVGFEGLKGIVVFLVLVVPPLVLLRNRFDKYISCARCGAVYNVGSDA